MQEILFRGFHKQADGPDVAIIEGMAERGKWHYGDLLYHVQGGVPHVFPSYGYNSADCYEIVPSTVGQYTGLTDKNGKKIFVGDTIICSREIGGNFVDTHIEKGYVEMKFGAFGLHRKQGYYRPFKDWLEDYEYEVTGTIYDAPPEGA